MVKSLKVGKGVVALMAMLALVASACARERETPARVGR